MGGSAFQTKTFTGPSTNTVFFGQVPDNFNMLSARHYVTGGGGVFIDSLFPANNVNEWTIFNTEYSGGSNAASVTLGANVTAPDGTGTAQEIIETTTNSGHYLTAGLSDDNVFNSTYRTSPTYSQRLGVFAKAGSRTRIALQVSDETQSSGCITVFDLAGGQIGVTNTAFGSVEFGNTYGVVGEGIIPFGNGWYLCYMDVTIGYSAANNIFAFCFIDSGSGTGSKNISYTGNGTSGVYVWRSTMLPPRAWGINNETFFDDFLSLDTIDVNNTQDPGYNWYVNSTWPSPGFNTITPTPADSFSVSDSILTITNGNAVPLCMMTACTDGGSGYIGLGGFKIPALFEINCAFDQTYTSTSAATFWTTSLGALTVANPVFPTAHITGEVDFFESGPQIADSVTPLTSIYTGVGSDTFNYPGVVESSQISSMVGYFQWLDNVNYRSGGAYVVYYNGSLYKTQADPNVGNIPSSSPSEWESFSIPSGHPPLENTPIIDFTQQNTFSTLWLPATKTDSGIIINFINGIFSGGYSENGGDFSYNRFNSTQQVSDGQIWPLIVACINPGYISIDWIKVTQ